MHAGQFMRYTLNVSNSGPSNSQGVAVTDQVPAMLEQVQWVVARADAGVVVNSGQSGNGNNVNVNADMPAGSSMLIFVEGRIDSSFAGTLLNTAYVIPSEPGNSPDTSSTQTVVTLLPDVQIAKAGPPTVAAGAIISWTVTATNDGPSLARAAHIIDNVPSYITNVSYQASVTGNATLAGLGAGDGTVIDIVADIPPGSAHSVVLTITGRVSPAFRDSIVNTAIIRPSEPGALADTSTLVTKVLLQPQLQIEKTHLPR